LGFLTCERHPAASASAPADAARVARRSSHRFPAPLRWLLPPGMLPAGALSPASSQWSVLCFGFGFAFFGFNSFSAFMGLRFASLPSPCRPGSSSRQESTCPFSTRPPAGSGLEGHSRLGFERLPGLSAEFSRLGCLFGSLALRSSGLSPGVHATTAAADSCGALAPKVSPSKNTHFWATPPGSTQHGFR
jgi:hypothetical protein